MEHFQIVLIGVGDRGVSSPILDMERSKNCSRAFLDTFVNSDQGLVRIEDETEMKPRRKWLIYY
jgi:hypothetical protein